MTVRIDPEDYARLLKNICHLYDKTLVHSTERSADTLMTYWQIGQCILQMVRPHGESGQYGKKIIRNLSSDLTQKYGDGFAPRTVGYFRNFAMRYAASQLNPTLSWSHYRALSGIENPDVRNTLEQRAINEKLTKEQLIQLIAHHRRTHHSGTAEFSLAPRTARPGIYRIVALPPTSNGQYILDLGFNIQHATALHCPDATPGGYIQQQSSRKYSTVQISPGERYCYPGTIVDIIDGDTVKMQLNPSSSARSDFSVPSSSAVIKCPSSSARSDFSQVIFPKPSPASSAQHQVPTSSARSDFSQVIFPGHPTD